jgi:hypothetical protein
MTVDDGSIATQTFTDLADSYFSSHSSSTLCGSRTFSIETTNNGSVSWCTVDLTSSMTYEITAAPISTITELQTTHQLRLKIVSDDYSSYMPAVYVNFNIIVNKPPCNCNLQPWTSPSGITGTTAVPTPKDVSINIPTVSSNAYTSSPAMRSCTVGSCATTGSVTAITLTDNSSLPSWISTKSGGTIISFAPTSGSVKSGNPWIIKATYTPTNGNIITYTAVTFTVTCEIASITISGGSTTSVDYTVSDSEKVIDGTSLTFT